MHPMGMWWAAIPPNQWPHAPGERPDEQGEWHPRYGDRSQKLVFIGQGIDEAAVRARLDACLLDARLAADDSSSWSDLPNPFPELQVAGGTATE